MALKELEWGLEVALMWLKTRSSEGLFWTRYWVLGFDEVWIIFWITKVVSCLQELLFHGVKREMDFVSFLMLCCQKLVRISQAVRACYVSHPTPFTNRILILFYWKYVLITVKYTSTAGLSILWCSCGSNAGNSWPGKFLSSTAYTCNMLPVGSRHRFTLVI